MRRFLTESLLMSNSTSARRRSSQVIVQTMIGIFALLAWLLIDALTMSDTTLGQSLMTALPFFVAFELGVLSRYLPGLQWIAKRIK